MTPPLMETIGVSRLFAGRGGGLFRRRVVQTAVHQVSLVLREGETVALVGENGSGKSTIGRLLLGLLPPSDGALHYRGEDLRGLRPPARRRYRGDVQAVFQDSGASLNPRRTAGQSIAIPLLYHGGLGRAEAADRSDALLESVGLDPGAFRDRWPHELSGGQRQRVNIARALGSDPSLIVADEPVSALDVSVRAQILALMARIQRSRTLAYLFITHDLGAVQALADRVVVLYRGSVMEEGAATAILAAPRHPYTQALLAARPLPDPSRRRARPPTLAVLPTIPAAGCRYSDRCPRAEAACREAEPLLRPLSGGTAARCLFA